LITLSCLKNMG